VVNVEIAVDLISNSN